jgi:hypothetical protein
MSLRMTYDESIFVENDYEFIMKTLIRRHKHYRIKLWLDLYGWWDAVIRDNRTNRWYTLKTTYRSLDAALEEVQETFESIELKPYSVRMYSTGKLGNNHSFTIKYKPLKSSKSTRFRLYRN